MSSKGVIPAAPPLLTGFHSWSQLRARLPKFVGDVYDSFDVETNRQVVTILTTGSDNKLVRFTEPTEDFPSDFLITQLLMVT